MNDQNVVIIGLGYIGLPTAALIANNNIKVHGVDINPQIVETINQGKIHIKEKGLEDAVASAIKKGFLTASVNPVEANTYIITVPTPLKGEIESDVSFVEAATYSVIPILKENDLFIIESTCPIGTTEQIMQLIYSERSELEHKLHIAYCPERVMPGNIMHELIRNDRVIGGVDEIATKKATKFYKQFVKGELFPTNARTAEMCKLVENSYRDVQIAFANELSLICDKADIDVWELIRISNKHPRVKILQPGSGVGGHCISVDPYFLIERYPFETNLIRKAREINKQKTKWCVDKIKSSKLEFQLKYHREATVSIMGLTFKPNIDDLRESPSVSIINYLLQDSQMQNIHGETFFFVEPNIKKHELYKLTPTYDAVERADIIAFLVAHDEFKDIELNNGKIILDFCGITNS